MALVAEVRQSAFDAVDALAHRRLREADEDGLGQPGRGIDFDLDRHGVDADEREGVKLGEHGGSKGRIRITLRVVRDWKCSRNR